MLRVIKQFFSTVPIAHQFVPPAPLLIQQSSQMPHLQINKSPILLTHAWGQKPFIGEKIFVPIFSLIQSGYSGQTIQMKKEIFNQPIRRDLIYRLYNWRINLNKFSIFKSRTQSETAGSGKKPRPQKGQGRARLGNIRAPGRKKGVKAHGAKQKIYSYHLNDKIKLKALKSLFSAKLLQGKIRIVDSQDLVEAKTKSLQKIIEKQDLTGAYVCFITSAKVDANFERAQRNIKGMKWYTSENFDVLDILKADKIILTKEGLKEITLNIFKSEYMIFRQPHMKTLEEKAPKPEQEPYNPQAPLDFKFRILEDYLKMYQRAKIEKSELLEKEHERVRKITSS